MNTPTKPEPPNDLTAEKIAAWMVEIESWIGNNCWSTVDMEREYAHSFVVLAKALGVKIDER